MTTPTPPSPGPDGPNRVRNGGGGNGGGGNGGHGPPPPHSDDPGPPAILVEFLPTLLDVTNAATMAAFVDKVQGAMAPLAAKLQAAGLRLAGPNAVAGNLRDDIPIVRVGLWILPPAFPFAQPDPAHPHQLPVLTAASQAKGFSDAPVIGVVEPQTLGGAFAFAIPVTTLNAFATAALPDLQSAAAKAGASLSSVSVTSVPPAPLGPSGGTVVTTFQGSAGFPSAGISGTITEELDLHHPSPGADTQVPGVTGNLSSGTDVGNEVLLGAALVLGGPDILGGLSFIEALGLTLGVPLILSAKINPQLAMVTALVGMIPQVLPFEPAHPVPLLPDFPELTFNWTTFAVTTTSEIIGRASVTVTGRPLGSGSLTLTGPASFVGIQDDMDGGTSGDYTVTWTDIAPTSFGWQAAGATGSSSGQIDPQVFPFQQGFSADFPLPQLVGPGRYHFGVQATATEVNVNNTSQALTAAAHQGVTIDVLKNPPHPP